MRVKSDREVALQTIEENRRLRRVVEAYARHLNWCAVWPEMNQPCDCGLATALSGWGGAVTAPPSEKGSPARWKDGKPVPTRPDPVSPS